MKVFGSIALFSLLGLSSATADYFTITQFGDLVPSGYKGSEYSTQFQVMDKTNKSSLTTCSAKWNKGKSPSTFTKCADPNWQWKFTSSTFQPCDFQMEIAHSVITTSGKTKTNTTSYGYIQPSQVPCNTMSGKSTATFGCQYAASGAESCFLGQGKTLTATVSSTTSKKSS